MPILPQEPDIFPAELFAPQSATAIADQPWWVIYTLSRREKDLMRRLAALEVPFYAPMIKHRKRTPAGRAIESYIPLFAGYVFLCGNEEARHKALTTNCVARCLDVPDPETLVRDLRQIQRLVTTGAPLTPESRVDAGTRVRIHSGSMAGLEGTVVRRRGKDWLVVAVEFLQRGASVLLEDYQVEPL